MTRSLHLKLSGRALLALLFAVSLVGGALLPHDADAEASGVSPWQWIDQAATHPSIPPHLEAPKVESHRGCTACLLQLTTQSSLAPVPQATAALPRCEAWTPAARAFPTLLPTHRSPARAPPAPPLPA